MNIENLRKWITALRSGKYQQGYFALTDDNGTFCALGVAADVLCKGKIYADVDYDTIKEALSVDREFTFKMIQLNDRQVYTFEQIADYLEKKYLLDQSA